MFGMNIVKVIHEELILLLVLDFDDVFDLHQEWSVSTEESAWYLDSRYLVVLKVCNCACTKSIHDVIKSTAA